jgi:hypothetical protein
MCDNYDKESSGIVCTVSRQVGAIAGTSVVISKKLAGCGIKTVTTTKDWLKRPLKILVPTRDKKSRTTSQASALESKDEQESLVSDLEQAKSQANEAAILEGEVKGQVTALESDLAAAQHHLDKSRKDEEIAKPKPPPDRAEMSSYAAVTDKEAQAAVFPNATDKIIFTRALSDIASQEAIVRADAVRAIGTVPHDLSVRVLAAQIADEPSALVRQECIRAMVALQMEEALPVVVNALADPTASVRLAAVWGLYHLSGVESVPEMKRMFFDEDEEVRRRAVTCIGWLGQKELAAELLPLLSDKAASVRLAAVEAMGKLRSRQVVSALIKRLNDPDKSIRKIVLKTIEAITGKKMGGPLPADEKRLQRLIARWRKYWRGELLK